MMLTSKDIIERRKELWQEHKDIEQDKAYRNAIGLYIMQEEAETLRAEIAETPEILIEMFFVVVDKEQKTVPFFLNELQQDLIGHIRGAITEYRAGKRNHLKFLLLKGRQSGFTTVISAFQLCFSIIQKNFAGYTLADNADNTEAIFTDKAKYTYDNLPEQLKPSEKYNSRRELHFDKLNSRWRVATAGNKDVGRSKTLNFFHGSECAFFSSLKTTLTGLGEALTKDAIQILETTANGYNEYKDLWDDTENTWEKLFYEWWRTSEYRLSFETAEIEQDFKKRVVNAVGSDNVESKEWCYKRCKWLLEVKCLDWEQLYWYYNKWKDKKEDIKQEYPCTPEEAFLASGSNYFDIEQVTLRKAELKDIYEERPYRRGYFEFEYVNELIVDNTIRWVDDSNGYIKMYEEVKEGYYYVGGGDTAGEGSDRCTGAFTNNITEEDVATLIVETDETLYAHQMYCLGRYYNNALLSIETNFSTYPVKTLTRLGYHNQYVREESPDKFTNKLTQKFGFNTNKQTRPLMLAWMKEEFTAYPERYKDIDTLTEMTTFVKNEKGKPEAQAGKHDDLIMARAINCYCASQQKNTPDVKEPDKGEIGKIKDEIIKKQKRHRQYSL